MLEKQFGSMQKNGQFGFAGGELLKLREAALQLGISFPTIKQWIYKKKIRTARTAEGTSSHSSERSGQLFRVRGETEVERQQEIHRVGGRNQLVGRIEPIQISGLVAEVRILIGDQDVTSIITSRSAKELQLKRGRRPQLL